MQSLLHSRLTLVWLVLLAATLASWAMGHGLGFSDTKHASIAIICVAFIKVRFVMIEFMEMGGAPPPMRLIGELWPLVVGSVLVVLYLSSPG
jgi:hypothetical protein